MQTERVTRTTGGTRAVLRRLVVALGVWILAFLAAGVWLLLTPKLYRSEMILLVRGEPAHAEIGTYVAGHLLSEENVSLMVRNLRFVAQEEFGGGRYGATRALTPDEREELDAMLARMEEILPARLLPQKTDDALLAFAEQMNIQTLAFALDAVKRPAGARLSTLMVTDPAENRFGKALRAQLMPATPQAAPALVRKTAAEALAKKMHGSTVALSPAAQYELYLACRALPMLERLNLLSLNWERVDEPASADWHRRIQNGMRVEFDASGRLSLRFDDRRRFPTDASNHLVLETAAAMYEAEWARLAYVETDRQRERLGQEAAELRKQVVAVEQDVAAQAERMSALRATLDRVLDVAQDSANLSRLEPAWREEMAPVEAIASQVKRIEEKLATLADLDRRRAELFAEARHLQVFVRAAATAVVRVEVTREQLTDTPEVRDFKQERAEMALRRRTLLNRCTTAHPAVKRIDEALEKLDRRIDLLSPPNPPEKHRVERVGSEKLEDYRRELAAQMARIDGIKARRMAVVKSLAEDVDSAKRVLDGWGERERERRAWELRRQLATVENKLKNLRSSEMEGVEDVFEVFRRPLPPTDYLQPDTALVYGIACGAGLLAALIVFFASGESAVTVVAPVETPIRPEPQPVPSGQPVQPPPASPEASLPVLGVIPEFDAADEATPARGGKA